MGIEGSILLGKKRKSGMIVGYCHEL